MRWLGIAIIALTVLVTPVVAARSRIAPITTIEVRGATLLSPDALRQAAGIPLGSNLLAVDLRAVQLSLAALPFVASVQVRAALPDRVVIDVHEAPLLMRWRVAGSEWLIGGDGRVIGAVTEPILAPTAAAQIAVLPLIDDQRATAGLVSGAAFAASTIDPIILDAATRLAGLAPADAGSASTSFALTILDQYGFTLHATGGGAEWTAVFGTYSASIRPTTLIPGQVRLLRSLLRGREAAIGWVILADDQAGTFTPRGVQPPPPSSAEPSQLPSMPPELSPSPSATASGSTP